MRIIERAHPNKSVLYVVQEETFALGGLNASQSAISSYKKNYTFTDIKSFATLQEAKDFMYQYANNLQPGERIVS